MLKECPHCLARVFPSADFSCPSCLKDTRAPSTSPETRIVATVRTAFPAFCCSCTTPTESVERIRGETYGANPLPVRLLAGLGLALFKPLKLFANWGDLRGEQTLFAIDIPRCDDCRKSGPLRPLHIDLARQEVLLQVRRSFAERLVAAAPPPR